MLAKILKKNMIHTDNSDPAMRYEGLARAAFNNCDKYGDPFGITAQDVYSSFVPKPKLRGKIALSKVLSKIIIDNSNSDFKVDLIEIEKRIWNSKSQKEIREIIDESIEILKKLDY